MAAQLVKSVARRADSRARRRIERAGANRSQARDAWPAKPQYRIRTNSRISDAHKPRSQERQPSSRACASRQTLIFIEIASRKLDCTQCFFDFSATHRHGGQRWILQDDLGCGVFGATQIVSKATAARPPMKLDRARVSTHLRRRDRARLSRSEWRRSL
ncbi:hypothetical protein [Turneriella parva]|uniref:Uncharacterized protein n=1 Tax=Turneriella parva (strain ATCC BAA-1111 / DSM 21527 / NCTC 11395 / H) TaxID=869212 RepID=I4BA10_TURPD|nr:hypothetical protein Turpa_3480 [Turneriella parva DSM 21527]